MSSVKSGDSGNILENLKDFALFCIPGALVASLLSWIQLVLISGQQSGSVNYLYPILFGLALGFLLIVLKRLGQSLARKMITDPLTGSLNRRWYQSIRDEVLEDCKSSKKDLSVVLFNIDHFKQVNDVNGHQAGDEVLSQMAQIVTRSLRGSDWLIRWGGDEFMILLPGTPSTGAMTIAERLRKVIASFSFQGASLVTCSFGVSQFSHETDTTLEDLINRADAALITAKNAGRNRVQDANDEIVANAENPELDKQRNRAGLSVRQVSSFNMYKHAEKLLDAPYARKLMNQSLMICIPGFIVLAMLKHLVIDGVAFNVLQLVLPLLIGGLIGFIVGRIRIIDKGIKTQNVIDPLTKTYNRHWLAGYGRQQIQTARRTGNPLSLALIDIDNFKTLNDRHGWATGDMILQQVADCIRESCTESARIIRWTGRIFMIILPSTDSDLALQLAEKIRSSIAGIKANDVQEITCSIGLTCFIKEEDKELHHLVERATGAMSQANSQGQNCVRVG